MGRLARHNYAAVADKGTFVQLRDPDTSHPLYFENFVEDAAHPEGGVWVPDLEKPVGLFLLGIDSAAYKAQEAKNRDEALDDMRKGVPPSASKGDERATKLLVACTTGWSNVPVGWIDGSDSDEEITFSPRAATQLYSNRGTEWVRYAADSGIADRARFLK
jgi:hypothetical protein